MEKIISQYLVSIDIPISQNYCEKYIISHPDYPSLLSAADTLAQLGIAHQIVRIEKEHLPDIPFPYLLRLQDQGKSFAIIKDQKKLQTYLLDTDQSKGVVLKAEAGQKIMDGEHNKQYARETLHKRLTMATGIALLAVFLIFAIQYASWLLGLLIATAIAGTGVGYLLLAKDVGVTYKPVETFCNSGKRTNCDWILHAKDAQLFGFFTFTDAAASYFIFQLLAAGILIPLSAHAASYLIPLAAASLRTIPVVGYSLYYQYLKANTWCRLCLIVDGILLAQWALFAGMYFRRLFSPGDTQIIPFAILTLLFVVVAAAIVLVKHRLKTANLARREVTSAKRVKHDPQVFVHMLQKEKTMKNNSNNRGMILGNPRAPVHVTMAANLFCNPCRMAFQTVSQLLAAYPQKICFSIRLTPGMNKTMNGHSASAYVIRYWQQHIYGTNNESKLTQKLLQEWYAQMDPQAFITRYPADGEIEAAGDNPESRHYKWVTQNDITATPTFFLNGYKMPNNYRLNDLKAMVPGLVAMLNRSINEDFA